MKLNTERGFTLVEIAVAVAILGIALTTLIGLHTRMLDIYLQEKARTQAAFYGQYILSIVEVDPQVPDPGTESGDLRNKLDELGYFDDNENGLKAKELIGWNYNIEVSSENFLELEDAYRRVDLSISWGPSEEESFSMVYFMKSPTLTAAIQAFQSTVPGSQNATPN
jgi:prepilin-type N-terminal cleavage/methylation domain-containing protein